MAIRKKATLATMHPISHIKLFLSQRLEVVDTIAGEDSLTPLRGSAEIGTVVSRNIVGMLATKLWAEGDGAAKPEVEAYQVFGISRFGARTLALEVIHELISDDQSAVMMVELMRDVVGDDVVRRKAVLC